METIMFGDRHDADRALARARNVHKRVEGVFTLDMEMGSVGTRYSAFDPELMLWVLAAIADSAQHFFELFVRKLDLVEKEALWSDYLHLGELFGMPRVCAPRTHCEFRVWWKERLRSNDIFLTPEAHQMGYASAFLVPMPVYATRTVKRLHNAIVLGSLPPVIRDLYGLSYTREAKEEFNRAVRIIRILRERSPAWVPHGSSRSFYRWVAREESRRIRLKRPTPRLTWERERGETART
jgi:uncharacterized protein (DUF2236 family)